MIKVNTQEAKRTLSNIGSGFYDQPTTGCLTAKEEVVRFAGKSEEFDLLAFAQNVSRASTTLQVMDALGMKCPEFMEDMILHAQKWAKPEHKEAVRRAISSPHDEDILDELWWAAGDRWSPTVGHDPAAQVVYIALQGGSLYRAANMAALAFSRVEKEHEYKEYERQKQVLLKVLS